MFKSRVIFQAIVSAIFMGCSSPDFPGSETTSLETLEAEFLNPPNSSRPRTWFHVMSGNMTKAGITKDLESIQSVGIGGVLLFNVTQGIPIGPVKFNSAEHLELVSHMAAESERLGLAFGVHNCDGWTSSGGPWITPENSMKKVVWSETYSSGGAINIVLEEPDKLENYYEDIATIAYPRLPGEKETADNRPKVTSSQSDLDIDLITDGSVIGTTRLEATEEAPAYIDFEYSEPFSLKSVRFRFMNARRANTVLLSSHDGINYRPVENLALRRPAKNDWGNDEALSETVTARYFRLQTDVPLDVQEVELSAVASIGNFWGRTGSAKTVYAELPSIGSAPISSIIDSASVIDLSNQLDAGGRLKAELPKGEWTIMRFGQTSTGAKNLPASKEGVGLEVDKFSRPALKIHYEAYMGRVVRAVKHVAPNAHQYTEIDSYEVAAQNWTTDYDALFREEKGYSLIPFLPLFAGRFVDSPEAAERVTWDMRDLSNELMRDNYYGYFTDLANADGLQVYIEPYGDGPFNELDAGSKADIPMGEFWVSHFGNRVNVAVSSAALYGKSIVSAEAFTDIWNTNWKLHPAYVKTLGDTNWALGINEFMFHRFAHQANTHVKPGMTMNRWGSHFDRTQTWWYGAGKEWFTYLSRGQHILRQGIPVNDALLFVGDGSPNVCPDKEVTDSVPFSINFICLNPDVLKNRLAAKDDAFRLPEGGAHKFIILENSETLTQSTLDALDKLSNGQGGLIIGIPPTELAGHDATVDERRNFAKQVEEIWAREGVYSFAEIETAGWQAFLKSINYKPDFEINGQSDVLFTHRKLGKHDIYFIHNSQKDTQSITAKFRVSGKRVSLWDAMDGSVEGVESYSVEGDYTAVDLNLMSQESVFVVFDGDRPIEQTTIEKSFKGVSRVEVQGPWTVSFDSDYGTDETIQLNQLKDWTDISDFNIKHYSGPALYKTQFSVPKDFLDSSERFLLDLGNVQIAATVTVNGIEHATSWLPPHQLDVSEALKLGENSITISVVNLWVNRLIGDASLPDLDGFEPVKWNTLTQMPPKEKMPEWYSKNIPPTLGKRVTFTTADFYTDKDELLPSGLIGPVHVIGSIQESD